MQAQAQAQHRKMDPRSSCLFKTPPPAPDWDDASAWARASGDRKAAREAERRAAGEAWPTDAGAYVLGEVLGCGATAKVSERD